MSPAAAAFRDLHASGCFLLPNAWDRGSARYLAGLGFPAIASTSSGFAWSRGRPDGAMDVDSVLAHLVDLVTATDLPVNADFENGFGRTAREVGRHVALAASTGVAGLSIEDSTGDADVPLFELGEAVDRIGAAREAAPEVVLVGRSEGFLWGRPDLDETIRRLRAYADAGADCLYAPGISGREQISAVVEAVAPKPVNVLVGGPSDLSVADLAALGVRRISVGGALARAAWAGFEQAARTLADGSFAGFEGAASGADLNSFFSSYDA
ncbi:MAG: isocitrate lyase/phosphoenolpyruvate mutase family protein [Nocardioidaceae bacterium]|nr:isocitrate lyase/phosphoenolpyruvate mutase family protein [Nocardioidaceae bacterium]